MVRSGGTKRKSQALLDSDSGSDATESGSDIEKEMLSLSKKKKPGSVTKKIRGDSNSDSSDSDSDWGGNAKGKKSKKKAGSRTNRRSISATQSSSDEDENKSDAESFAPAPSTIVSEAAYKKTTASDLEEGEVSTSEETSDDTGDEFDDGFDENLMGDEEDKRNLNSMTEKEREQEIFKRIEQREVMRTRFDIEKKLRQAKKKELKKQKKAEQSSQKFKMDAKERSKERKKTVEGKVDKKSQAMDLLKARREAKKERLEEKEKARKMEEKIREDGDDELDLKDDVSTITEKSSKKKLKASDIYSDDSGSSSDSEQGSDGKIKKEGYSSRSSSDSEHEARASSRHAPEYVSMVSELNRIRLSRQQIEKFVHFPIFEKLAKGTFVRLGIGQSRDHKPVYRITEVLEIVETPRVYQLGSTRTNKGFKLRHGSSERVFRYEFISTNEFSLEEFDKWKETCQKANIALPTLDDIKKKEKEMSEVNSYQFRESDIEHIIEEKKRFKQSPVNFAVRKTELMKMKDTAQQRGDESRVEELARELADIDERAKELDKARSQSISSISYINERNRKRNVEQAEKAIMEEIEESKGKKVEDPFTRRSTKPMPMVVNRPLMGPPPPRPNSSTETSADNKANIVAPPVALSDLSAEDIENNDLLKPDKEENEDEVEPERPATPEALKHYDFVSIDDMIPGLKQQEAAEPKPRTITTGDLFLAHDFDIQLELDAKLPPNLPIVARPSAPHIREPIPRRSLNLEDYKRKRGLI